MPMAPYRAKATTALAVFSLLVCAWLLFLSPRRYTLSDDGGSVIDVDVGAGAGIIPAPATTRPASATPTTPSTSSTSGTLVPRAAELVVASRMQEDTRWIHQYLPEWPRNIYIVDNASAALTVPKNKGHEAMVYLTYLIDRYDTLPDVSVFIHASRFAWHNDNPDYDNVAFLRRLKVPYIRSQGYVNLRCVWVLGCPSEIRPHVDALSADELAVSTAPVNAKYIYKQAFEDLMPGEEVPAVVGVSCCSQFAVSRDAVRHRPKKDYVHMRDWLLKTPLADDLSGRVLEYSWHIIFGKESVFCPNAGECYCKVYGLCDLSCNSQDKCDNRYHFPTVATLPHGWPRIGWDGERREYEADLSFG
ncbi:hypothetical protein B0T17DRAFT_541196 [Bombardia bombarda]|uniref:Uncharacterized protein n=1 Tax=Bombardia bombarda TaxID=252184 RepID=A0AA39WGV4_9PEZI|nr:hypothetical protein B0T17DRAFT_541196 [Bombardia bombarda]